MADAKRPDFDHVEDTAQRKRDLSVDDEELPEPGSVERIAAERRLVRKLDFRLMPMLFLIFIMNYIDVSTLNFYRMRACVLTTVV
jgi:hypothetical protein